MEKKSIGNNLLSKLSLFVGTLRIIFDIIFLKLGDKYLQNFEIFSPQTYLVYPPKISSPPSPVRATVTFFFNSFAIIKDGI